MERAPSDKSTRGQYFVQPEYESLLLANHLADAKDILSLAGYVLVLLWRDWPALLVGAFLFVAWSALSLPTTFTVVAT